MQKDVYLPLPYFPCECSGLVSRNRKKPWVRMRVWIGVLCVVNILWTKQCIFWTFGWVAHGLREDMLIGWLACSWQTAWWGGSIALHYTGSWVNSWGHGCWFWSFCSIPPPLNVFLWDSLWECSPSFSQYQSESPTMSWPKLVGRLCEPLPAGQAHRR